MNKTPLVISFYTENTLYQREAMDLITSCRKHGIEAEIEALACTGCRERNSAMKPFFIRKKLLEKKRPLFWVDADAVFKKKPNFSFLSKSDIAFREMKKFSRDSRFKYAAHSLYLNYTPRTLEFVDKWCESCQNKIDRNEVPLHLEQIALIDLIERGQHVKILRLPISYCKVFALDAQEIEAHEVVIEHFESSRRFRYWRN